MTEQENSQDLKSKFTVKNDKNLSPDEKEIFSEMLDGIKDNHNLNDLISNITNNPKFRDLVDFKNNIDVDGDGSKDIDDENKIIFHND